MFLDPHDFSFLARAQSAWPALKAEYEKLAHLSRSLPVPLHDDAWDVILVHLWGSPLANAPVALEATDDPKRRRVAYSMLRAGGVIRPHSDDCNCIIAHLTLIPSPDTAIRVGSEVREFVPGEFLVFDERNEHEVWNRGDKTRVTLLFGFDPENRPVGESEQAISSHFKKWWNE